MTLPTPFDGGAVAIPATVGPPPTPAIPGRPFTHVGPLGSSANNTEGTTGGLEGTPPAPAAPGAATTAPVFTPSVVQSSRAHGLATDIIRLTVSGVQASGTDPTALWQVTVSGVKADLGPAVSPGELRVVPFAYNGAPSTTTSNQSPLFQGNVAGDPSASTAVPAVINIYTVPAYVAPVTFTIGTPSNIVADGVTQKVGDITIAETNNYSLQGGAAGTPYQVRVSGATVQNNDASPVTVTTTNAATGETVSSPAVVTANSIQFTLTQTDVAAANASKLSITLSGLLLSSNVKGQITYTISGGSIDSFLATAGTSPLIGGTPPNGVLADSAFGTDTSRCTFATAVNQCDIEAPALVVNAVATDVVHRIGGSDRFETAAKVALNGNAQQTYIVLASGEDFPDALSSGYLAHQLNGGGSILLTRHDSLPAVTADAMRLLGTQTVYVVGGPGAISDSIVAQLRATPQYYQGGEITQGQGRLQVTRLGGIDRYATNQVVNQYAAALFGRANPVGRTAITFGVSSKLTALVATGEDFPDALAAGPATAGVFRNRALAGGLPLILTRPGSISPTASSQLNNLGIEQAVILGGTGAVSSSVSASIAGTGVAVDRIGGANRFATAAMIADFETASPNGTATTTGGLGFDSIFCESRGGCETAYLATGLDFADALAGAPLAGGSGSPILLTNPTTLSPETMTWLSAHNANYSTVIGLGLAGAVSNAALNAANAAVAGG